MLSRLVKNTLLDAEFFRLKVMYMRAFRIHPSKWALFHYPEIDVKNYDNPLLSGFQLQISERLGLMPDSSKYVPGTLQRLHAKRNAKFAVQLEKKWQGIAYPADTKGEEAEIAGSDGMEIVGAIEIEAEIDDEAEAGDGTVPAGKLQGGEDDKEGLEMVRAAKRKYWFQYCRSQHWSQFCGSKGRP